MGGCPTPPVSSFALAYPKSSFLDVDLPDGSGNLRDLPHTWPCCLAQASSPDGYNLLSSTIGGTRYAAVGVMSEDDIVAAVDRDLRMMMLIRPEAPPPKVLGVRVWPNAIPQYELGHSDTMAELKRMEDANDVVGLWVCGSYWTGVSLTACVNFGHDHAKVVAGHLTSKRRVRDADVKEAPSLTQVNYIEFIWSNHEQPCMLKLQSSSMILYKTFCYTATYSHSSPLSLINSIGVY